MSNPYESPSANLGDGQYRESYEPSLFGLGRIGRIRYLAYNGILNLLIGVVVAILAGVLVGLTEQPETALIGSTTLAYIALAVVSFLYGIRRLNDLNRSGWMSLLFVVPLINLLFILYLMFWPGDDAANDYGPPPTKNTTLMWIAALLLPLITVGGILAAIAIPAYQEYVNTVNEARSSE